LPGLGSPHRSLESSPPYFLGSVFIKVNLVERVLDVTERPLADVYSIRVLKFLEVRLFEDRPKSDCCLRTSS
jgi:hypothetical protein